MSDRRHEAELFWLEKIVEFNKEFYADLTALDRLQIPQITVGVSMASIVNHLVVAESEREDLIVLDTDAVKERERKQDLDQLPAYPDSQLSMRPPPSKFPPNRIRSDGGKTKTR